MGFTFGGINSASKHIKVRLTNWQASPPLRNAFVSVPGKAGVADFGADIGEKTITLRCNIWPQHSFPGLVSVLDSLAEWLDPEKGLRQLVLDDVPDRYFMARLQTELDCDRLILAAGAFDLKFVCPDPFAYAILDETYTLTTVGTSTITRSKGSSDSFPVYLLKASIPGGAETYVSIKTNQEELKIVGPLVEGETLVIDSGLVTAKVVDTSGEVLRNGLPLLSDLRFPTLRKGANEIVVSQTGASFNELQIFAKSRWR